MNKQFTIILSAALAIIFLLNPADASEFANKNAKKSLKMVQKEYSQNLVPALKILQRDNQDELFIKGWKVENAFERMMMLNKVNHRDDPYLEINRTYDLAVKSRYNKYKNIYIVSFKFALGDSGDYVGFYWWVDPVNYLILDISRNRKLCRKYRLRQYSQVYATTLRLERYKDEIQKMKTEIDM